MKEYITYSEEETAAVAAEFAATLTPRSIIALHGTLGAGKSVFARALIRRLTQIPDIEVPSPTFTLVQTYEFPLGTIWHFDLLTHPDEIFELGWEDALSDGLIILEWPQRLAHYLPARTLNVLMGGEGNERRIHMNKVII
jgi:tRNA threonylcarbamoyladenosine biosynthesis protein TsaE